MSRGLAVPSSGIIDLAIGLTFVFGVTAALASVATELIARLIGLRGAYLLSGLRELLDGGEASMDLGQAEQDYKNHAGHNRARDGNPRRTAPSSRRNAVGDRRTARQSDLA